MERKVSQNDYEIFLSCLQGLGELYGKSVSEGAVAIWWAAVQHMSIDQFRHALGQHVRDPDRGRFFPMPADVIGKMQSQDGHPGPDEAFSMLPRTELETAVLTEQIMTAWRAIGDMLERDEVAARMAFRETYGRELRVAREQGRAPRWFVSMGWDTAGREAALVKAIELGRLSVEDARHRLPHSALLSSMNGKMSLGNQE